MKYSVYAVYEKEIYGKTTSPNDVQNFNLLGVGNNALLSWDRPTDNADLDVINGGYYRIRYTSELTTPTWSGATNIGGLVSGASSTTTVPLLAGSYLIKAYDSSGNESVNAVAAKSNVATLMSMNAVHTCTEETNFLGTHTDTTVQNNSLRLAEISDADYSLDPTGTAEDLGTLVSHSSSLNKGLITVSVTTIETKGGIGSPLSDSLSGSYAVAIGGGTSNVAGLHDFDDPGIDLYNEVIAASDMYDYGAVGTGASLVKTLGYYDFNCNNIDLGQSYTSRVSADITLFTTDVGTTFDSASGLFDSNSGKFDGGDVADADGELQLRTTTDDPASPSADWGSWTPFSVGDYVARGYQFRMKLWTADPNHNVVVTKLATTIDMPDRIDREYDLGTSGGTKSVVFSNAYKTRPSVGITAQDLSTGDYWALTGQTNTGFTVTFYNASNQQYGSGGRPERTFNYIAVGY